MPGNSETEDIRRDDGALLQQQQQQHSAIPDADAPVQPLESPVSLAMGAKRPESHSLRTPDGDNILPLSGTESRSATPSSTGIVDFPDPFYKGHVEVEDV
ncbi:hypothetical protein CGRA01v4_06915 [Colletotrichum graminicola]|nr:hypothetical protein CGRA01v4_06915 [Colletotrichum graminicola]